MAVAALGVKFTYKFESYRDGMLGIGLWWYPNGQKVLLS